MWLLTVREVDVRVTETSSGSTVYAECNEKLEKMLLGKKLFSVSADEIVTELEKDPYVTVKRVKRRFPDAVEVEIEERAECFAVKNEELYYILDRDYNLLDKRTTLEKEGGAGKILPVEVKNVKLGFAAFRVGKPITYDETGMFGYAVRLFRSLDDLNFLKRSGRVSGATAMIANVLNIKPILYGTADGHIVSCAKCRGRKKAIEYLAEEYAKKAVDPRLAKLAQLLQRDE